MEEEVIKKTKISTDILNKLKQKSTISETDDKVVCLILLEKDKVSENFLYLLKSLLIQNKIEVNKEWFSPNKDHLYIELYSNENADKAKEVILNKQFEFLKEIQIECKRSIDYCIENGFSEYQMKIDKENVKLLMKKREKRYDKDEKDEKDKERREDHYIHDNKRRYRRTLTYPNIYYLPNK